MNIQDLAEAKGFNTKFLKELGVRKYKAGLLIPYRKMDGAKADKHRIRTALTGDRFRWTKGNGDIIPYGLDRLENVSNDGRLTIVEGETDTWTLWKCGLHVLGIPGSQMVNKIKQSYLEDITKIVLYKEPDEGGEEFVKGVKKRLQDIGWTGELAVFSNGEGDVNDLYKNSGKNGVWEALQNIETETFPEKNETGPSLLTTSAADVEPQEVEWLWTNRLAKGKLHLLDGDPGTGKSTFTIDIASRLSTASPLPGEQEGPDEIIPSLFISAEDGPDDTIVPRLVVHQADRSRIFLIDGVETKNEDVTTDPFTLPHDVSLLEREIKKHGAGFVVFDPLMAFLGERYDSHNDQAVRRALHPLSDVAERTGAAILCIRHLRKSKSSNPKYRGGGSIGIIGAARVAHCIGSNPNKDDEMAFAPLKTNLGPEPETLGFKLIPAEKHDCAKIEWTGSIDCSVENVLEAGSSRTNKERAIDLIQNELKSGPKKAKHLKNKGEARGISKRTMDRASKELDVEKSKDGFQGEYIWSLSGQGSGEVNNKPDNKTVAGDTSNDDSFQSGEVGQTPTFIPDEEPNTKDDIGKPQEEQEYQTDEAPDRW